MDYYISEHKFEGVFSRTAGGKAREDAEQIFSNHGLTPIVVETVDRSKLNLVNKLLWHFKIPALWKEKTKGLKLGDSLVVQFPVLEHSVFLFSFFRSLKKRGIRVVFLIHDLESFRNIKRSDYSLIKRIKMFFEELSVKYCAKMIVHNDKMLTTLIQRGIEPERMVSLEIFDYLIPNYSEELMKNRKNGVDMPIIIAGHLTPEKARYVYCLPENYDFSLYGPEYSGNQNDKIVYHGSFSPEELPYKLDGSFGLVWDGTSSDSCQGVFGEYLKINNPHKTSLYIASGIPIVIWEKAALSDFVKKYNCGITVSSLYDIKEATSTISEEDYRSMKDNASKLGEKLRSGYFLHAALSRSLV